MDKFIQVENICHASKFLIKLFVVNKAVDSFFNTLNEKKNSLLNIKVP